MNEDGLLLRFARRSARATHYAALAGLVVPALVGLRFVELDVPPSGRMLCVLAVMAAGAAIAAFIVDFAQAAFFARLPALIRAPLVAALLLAAMIGASAAVFAVTVRDLAPAIGSADTESTVVEHLLSHGSAAYLMILSGWNQMFPWPFPVAAGLLALLSQMEGSGRLRPRESPEEANPVADIPQERLAAVLARRPA